MWWSSCVYGILFLTLACQGTKVFQKVQDRREDLKGKLTFQSSTSVGAEYPFRNVSLPWNVRIDDLVSRLTLDEVVLQLSRGGAGDNGPAPAIDRLGIKPYNWNTECLRGYGLSGEATCFPQPIGLAATFSEQMITNMATVVGVEARAKYNNYSKSGIYGDHTGLSCFAPVINIMRHPLWGRNQETYGEDPVLTSTMAAAYVYGLNGVEVYPAATAVCKHFDAYAGPENIPTSRFSFNANVSDHDLGTTFLPAFRSCVGAGADGVMCSYNAINGVPACANKMLLTDILRKTFGFKGYVVSDEGAVEHVHVHFHYTKSSLETAIVTKNAGVDLDLTYFGTNNSFSLLPQAVKDGNVTEESLRESAKRLFFTRMKLGEFDPPSMNPYNKITLDVIQSADHRELAKNIAAKSFVLLKNNGGLPLSQSKYKNIAVVGPFANNSDAVTGDYQTNYDLRYFSSPIDFFGRISDKLNVAAGCAGAWDETLPRCDNYKSSDIKTAVTGADLVVVTLGTGRGVEAESRDRKDMSLPGQQLKLLQDAVQYAAGAPLIVLLFTAGPVEINWAVESSKVQAILQCHFSAQATGDALEMVLLGHENPAGRLPYTWPSSMDQVPPMTNYTMQERTYRYFTSTPLFPFGYGLSYTTFEYVSAKVPIPTVNVCNPFRLLVEVKNTGHSHGGDEVIQVYQVSHSASVSTPLRQLVGFRRLYLEPQTVGSLSIDCPVSSRAVWKNGNYYVEPGKFTLFVGGQQPHQAVALSSNVIELQVEVTGSTTLLSSCET